VTPGELLLSVDYEGGDRGLPAPEDARLLPELTERLLAFFDRHGARSTFFVVAAVAERFPALVRAIASAGHEIGLHGCRHQRLGELGPRGFADDVRRGVSVLVGIGLPEPVFGFRAPFLSLTPGTRWALDVLRDAGFVYDSSTLPAWNPVTGNCAGEPRHVRRLQNGLWSVPLAIVPITRAIGVQIGGGVYLRLLPLAFQRWGIDQYTRRGEPACIYIHPYEIDSRSPVGAVFGRNALLNGLLRIRRSTTLHRLDRVIDGHRVTRIIDHLRRREAQEIAVAAR
jgi:polysaccharide deacetylase family protein (PEP-CTERM system associated)